LAEGPAEDLDALIKRVDPDRWLSSRFIADPEKRADVIALYAFDYELRRAVEGTSNPIMAEIRLTWWSEALDEIYERRPVRKHPTAEALARAVERRGPPRDMLEEILEARSARAPAEPLLAEVAAFLLDPNVDRTSVRAAVTGDRRCARRVSAGAFPAVAHVAARGAAGALRKRLRVTWAVLRGRL
jgi:phytoene synthase